MGAHTLDREGYLRHLSDDGHRLADVGRRTPIDGRVSSYPAYAAGTLAAHVAVGLRRLTTILETAKTAPLPHASPPGPGESVYVLVEAELAAFLDVAGRMDLGERVEHFLPSAPQTAGLVVRIAATELAIHRWDLETVTGEHLPIAGPLAADLVDALFDVWVPARLGNGPPVALGGTACLEASDTGDRWLVESADGRLRGGPIEAPVRATATLTAPISDLLLVLWKRLDRAAPGIACTGDTDVLDRFLALDYVPDPKTSPAR
jgi:hypothetical protein